MGNGVNHAPVAGSGQAMSGGLALGGYPASSNPHSGGAALGPAAASAVTSKPAAKATRTTSSGPRSDHNALSAFDTLINADAGGHPQTRRQVDPDRFALAFARYGQQRRDRPGGVDLEPGRTHGELEQLAESGALYDRMLMGMLFRGRLAAMVSAIKGPHDLLLVARALRHVPDWVMESPDERDERLNAMAGVRVEDTRAARIKAQEAQRAATSVTRTAATSPVNGTSVEIAVGSNCVGDSTPLPVSALEPAAGSAPSTVVKPPPDAARPNRSQRWAVEARTRKGR